MRFWALHMMLWRLPWSNRRLSCTFGSPTRLGCRAAVTAVLVASVLLSGCASSFPGIGPSRARIEQGKDRISRSAIQVVDVTDGVTRHLLAQRTQHLFSETLHDGRVSRTVGAGDLLEVSIWEAAPATLFSTSSLQMPGAIATSHATTLPDQMVDDDGFISVPFAGRIPAAGKSLQQIEAEIVKRLGGKANQPQVLVRLTHNSSANATVVGDVNTSTRVPLIPGNDRLLDALAAAGGVRQPVTKMTIQITRAKSVYSLPLETIIRNPEQNVTLLPGDVVTALFQPFSFTALGATGKNEEVNFETQGINLAQALARSGGLIDSRSNAKGVFIFRFEPKDALDWPRQPALATPEGMVPVVYRIDLTNPGSFFLMQSFPIENKDVLYVSNAPVTELQKFLNLLFTVAYPVIAVQQVGGF
jgi:polysaccharide biosynthesis/export protein